MMVDGCADFGKLLCFVLFHLVLLCTGVYFCCNEAKPWYIALMLKRLHFTNFKSWEEVDMPCRPLTGIFGTNSSGKSSLLQFLLLLKQTRNEADRALSLSLRDDLVDLGVFKDVIHKHDLERIITFDLEFALSEDLELWDSYDNYRIFAEGRDFRLTAEVEADENKAPLARRLAYEVDGMRFCLQRKRGSKTKFDLQAHPKSKFEFRRNQGRAWELPGPVKSYAFPDQVLSYYQNAEFLPMLTSIYEKVLDEIFYLGPLREFPKRDYLWSGSRPSDVGQEGESVVDAILAASQAGEKRNVRRGARKQGFQETIAYWLRRMGMIQDFRVKEIAKDTDLWQVHVQTKQGGSDVLLTDVGFGVSQVLPVITLLQYAPEGATVLLEQPEIHLHPLAQTELADAILQAVAHRKIQVILESHSELLLLRLQRRIAEEYHEIGSDDVALYFCDVRDGISKMEDLALDLYGNIRNWPENFMGDAFGETSEAELARLRRKKKA